MLLKRNLLTILSAVLFILFWGTGFAVLTYLALINTTDQTLVAGIIIAGALFYMIVSFFLREKGCLKFFQEPKIVLFVLELLLLIFSVTAMYYVYSERSLSDCGVILALLVSLYACGRLLGGRLCSLVSLIIGFFFILATTDSLFDPTQYIDTLCFLVPFMAFLFVMKLIQKKTVSHGVLIFGAYLALIVIFTTAILIHPLSCVILIGCIFSVIFSKKPENSSAFSSGLVCAGIVTAGTAILLFAVNFFVPDLFPAVQMPVWDGALLECQTLEEAGYYLIDKYTRAVSYLYLPFEYGAVPALLSFLGILAGCYAIRKKHSGLAPLCLSYLIVLVYYLCVEKIGSHFYYMTYFLPVFSAYGLYNTLIPLESPLKSDGGEEPDIPAFELTADTTTTDTPVECTQTEYTAPENISPDSTSSDTNEKTTAAPEETMTMTANTTAQTAAPITKKETEKMRKQKKDRKKAAKPRHLEKASEENRLVFTTQNEIPEWTISENYTVEKTTSESGSEAETESTSEIPSEPSFSETDILEPQTELSEPADTFDLPEAESAGYPEPSDLSAEETVSDTATDTLFSDSSMIDSDLEKDNILAGTDNFAEEAVLAADNDISGGILSEDNRFDNRTIMSGDPSSLSETVNEDEQLNDLLDRLDLTDNIRRMNEVAQEDMADIIERDDQYMELSDAIPATEIDITDEIQMISETAAPTLEPEIEFTAPTLEPEIEFTAPTLEPEIEFIAPTLEPEIEFTAPTPEPEAELEPEEPLLTLEPEAEPEGSLLTLEPEAEPEGSLLALEPEAEPEEPLLTLESETHSTLPKYVKPDFEFTMKPVTRPLESSDFEISEYDKVPTINDLEKKWRNLNEDTSPSFVEEDTVPPRPQMVAEDPIMSLELPQEEAVVVMEEKENGFAYSLEDVKEQEEMEEPKETDNSEAFHIHSEEVVKTDALGRRSYHKIIIK